MTRNQHVRKKLFIDPQVQGALLRRLLMHWVSAMAIGFSALLLIQVFSNGFRLSLGTHLVSMWNDYSMLFVVLLFSIPALAYDSIKLSHRFAGPVYVIRTRLKQLADGEVIDEVGFREGDFWCDIADSLNKISAKLDAQRVLEEQGETTNTPS